MTGIAWGVGIGVSNALWGGCNWGRGDVQHQRQPLQQHQRQQAPRRQQQPDQLEPQSGAARQHAVSWRRRDAQESREQARRRQPRPVPRQGREPRREPRPRAAVDAGARRRRRFGLGPRTSAERRPRRRQAEGAGRRPRCGPFEGTEHRSRRGPAARAADLAGQRAQGRGRPTGQAAGRPRRVQPEGRRPLRRWGCRTVARRQAVAPRRPHRPEEVAHGRRRPAAVLGRVVAAAGAVGPARGWRRRRWWSRTISGDDEHEDQANDPSRPRRGARCRDVCRRPRGRFHGAGAAGVHDTGRRCRRTGRRPRPQRRRPGQDRARAGLSPLHSRRRPLRPTTGRTSSKHGRAGTRS